MNDEVLSTQHIDFGFSISDSIPYPNTNSPVKNAAFNKSQKFIAQIEFVMFGPMPANEQEHP